MNNFSQITQSNFSILCIIELIKSLAKFHNSDDDYGCNFKRVKAIYIKVEVNFVTLNNANIQCMIAHTMKNAVYLSAEQAVIYI